MAHQRSDWFRRWAELVSLRHNNPITKFDPLGLKTKSDYQNEIKDIKNQRADAYRQAMKDGASKEDRSKLWNSYNDQLNSRYDSISKLESSAAYHNKTVSQWTALYNKMNGTNIDPSKNFVNTDTLDDETDLGKQVLQNHSNKKLNDVLYTAYAAVSLGGMATTRGTAQQAFKGGLDDVFNSVDDIGNMADDMVGWLGKDAKTITNKAGDKIFLSKDGTRRIRFDINQTTPHKSPHGHVETLQGGKWIKSGPVYPQGVPKQ